MRYNLCCQKVRKESLLLYDYLLFHRTDVAKSFIQYELFLLIIFVNKPKKNTTISFNSYFFFESEEVMKGIDFINTDKSKLYIRNFLLKNMNIIDNCK